MCWHTLITQSSCALILRSLPAAAGLVVLCCLQLGCAVGGPSRSVEALAPLQFRGETLTVADVSRRVVTPELLNTDQAMRDFVALYTDGVSSDRQRLITLHRAIAGRGALGVQYDPLADGGAQEVFYRGSANCLSYAHLFVALAREAGLDASYQWLELRPEWTRMGERVVVRRHVNVSVNLGSGGHYMVDIDPRPTRDIAGTREIGDRQAQALYHSNIGMQALAKPATCTPWNWTREITQP